MENILEWGDMIICDFEFQNAANFAKSKHLSQEEKQQIKIDALVNENFALKSELCDFRMRVTQNLTK